MKRASLVLSLCLVMGLAAAGAQEEGDVVELIWTCPLHREQTSHEPGRCALCEGELVRARVQEAWSCPVHSIVAESAPGTCPVCGRDLYPVSQEVSYACPMHAEVRELEPGACPICRMALVLESSARPHQDHNPKHGGIFFMAPDAWHHLEGIYPEKGVFRLYLYDNFSRPLSAKTFKGRAVLKESYDAATRKTRELVAYPLLPAAQGQYLEARVGSDSLPREITAKVQFARGGPFERFDFVFPDLSRAAEDAPPPSRPGELVVPETPVAIAVAIVERREGVRDLIAQGAFDRIYVPALEAKDLALALEGHVGDAAASDRASLRWALKELVRSAWLLDDYGDLGNREKVRLAYDRFEEASGLIATVYGVER